jgi:Membrane bound O-acyl transferase family
MMLTASNFNLMLLSLCFMILISAICRRISLAIGNLSPEGRRRFQFSPLISTLSLRRLRKCSMQQLRGQVVSLGLFLLLWFSHRSFLSFLVRAFQPGPFVTAYLALPAGYFVGEILGSSVTLLFSTAGWLAPPHHRNPLSAESLEDFWGHRWNRWWADWFLQIGYRPLRSRPAFALLCTFLLSGLIHEFLIALPFFVLFKKALFGRMTAYFLLQGMGILATKKRKRWKRTTLWAFVILPAPLFFNEATLRIFGFWKK